jgi:hypothetical protein
MTTAQYDFYCNAGADFQKVIRMRDNITGHLVALLNAVMEIRNQNHILVMRLDANSGRCLIAADGATIQLHITANDSLEAFQWGNFPGSVQAVGYWGIGRSYLYDMFVTYVNGPMDRILRGFFYVDPNITEPHNPALNPALAIGLRGNYE